MGAKVFSPPDPNHYGSSAQQAVQSSSDSVQCTQSCHYGNAQTMPKKCLAKLPATQENTSNEYSQDVKEKPSRKNIENVGEGCSRRKVRTTQKKPFARFQAIQEDTSDENSESLEEESCRRYVRDAKEDSLHASVQMVREKPLGKLQTIQEDTSNGNPQILKEGSSHEYVQAEEGRSSHGNDPSAQEGHSYEKLKTADEEIPHDQDDEEGSSRGNINVMGEGSRDDQPGESPHVENVEAVQEKPRRRDTQVSEGSSHRNDQTTQEVFPQDNRRCCTWLRKISVEPSMWLYMMAFMFTSVVEQDFFLYKACRVDHGYSEETCMHLKDYKDVKTEVQKTVSEFQQWYNFAGHIVPIILALFFGNWSDRRGRKLPLVIGLTGKLIYSLMIVVNSLMKDWNLNMVTYTAVLPMGILGGDVMIFGSCFAYLTDICSLEERTIRITILDVVYLSTMPTGIALGSYVFANVGSSYAIMFAINASMLLLAIVYSLVRLKWQTTAQQRSFVGVNFLKDFFDVNHVRETVNTMTKWRSNHGRLCLTLVMLAMCLYTFQRDEKAMSYLYTQLVFNWDVAKFSNFRTFQSSLFVIAMLCAMPLLKYLKLKDTIIVVIGATSHALGRLVFIAASQGRIFYIGAVVAAFGPVVAPALRSMASKLVEVEERGKVFAILSVFDNAVPLISSIFYSQLYNATILTVPNFIYWLTFTTQACVMLLAVAINFARNACAIRTYCFRNDDPIQST